MNRTSIGSSVGKYRWVICALLFFATTINYLDRQVLSLLAPALSKEFGWSNTDYANIAAAFQFIYAVALLFALFKVKPSPFCVLDEMDAALDEANVARFVKMVKGFLNQSQFILITHSRQTIAAADVIYGVTMPNRGVSCVMSMKFADYQESDAAKK